MKSQVDQRPDTQDGSPFKSGFCAIIGRPNVGKSTLLNRVIGQKVTIVSDKPQTTRNKIQCIWTTDDAQVVFLDTPGMHRPQDRLGQRMMEMAQEALEEVDVILFVVDGAQGAGRGDQLIAERLESVSTPVGLVINKIDLVSTSEREQVRQSFKALGSFDFIHMISATTGDGVGHLLNQLVDRLPPGPKYYPDDWITDHPERFIAGELIREQAIHVTREEIPYAIAVVVERMEKREDRDLVDLDATLYVERESQKGIVIGKGGARLKQIGASARGEIERLLGSQVNLQLWVKVRSDWRDKESALREFGYRS